MSARTPRVSVCLPVYNGANYLAASIASVLAQTWEDLRLIVVDNCSTDETPDIVRSFADRRLAYHRNPSNIGLPANFNRCLDLADGELVCIWHHDDVMLPTNLERKVRALDDHPRVGFVHSNLWRVDADGRRLAQHWHEDSRLDYVASGVEWFRRFVTRLHQGALVFGGAVVTRRACYERVGRFRSELPNCCDNEMWMRLALSFDVACLGSPLVEYRKHSTSASSAQAGPNWLAEHFAAARAVFGSHGAEVPHGAALHRQVRANFAREAMLWANETSYQGRFGESRGYLALATRIAPRLLVTGRLWWLLMRWAGGRAGVRAYGRFRERLGRAAR